MKPRRTHPPGQPKRSAKGTAAAPPKRTAKGPPAVTPGSGDPHAVEIVAAEFVAGAGPGSDLPAPTGTEIAFAGRSNVGKSSLINTLLQRKSLVRTSSTPGSTRQLNLYEARARDGAVFRLVDLPGYGFARRSKAEQSAWASLIEGYLQSRVTLAVVVIIVDVRRGLEEDDRELIEFIETASSASRRPVEVVLVATKLDKVPRAARRAEVEKIVKSAGRKLIGFSAETGEGRNELWRVLRRMTLGAPLADTAQQDEGEGEPADSAASEAE